MKGYKAFEKGMICRGKQYAENTIFEEESAEICKKGMHFCKNPLDVLNYYPLVSGSGNVSEFAEVESLDHAKTSDGKKYVTTKLKVGKRLTFADLVKASVNVESEECVGVTTSNENDARIISPGDWATISSLGNWAEIDSSGDYTIISSSGDWATISSSGDYTIIGSSGKDARIGSSGKDARIGSSGDYAIIGSLNVWADIASSGDSARIASSGDSARIASSGDYANITSSGDSARIASSGKDCIIYCAGRGGLVKAKIGSWITLTEWKYNDEKDQSIPVCVKTEQVDGVRIKEDVFYMLCDGEFVKA